MTPLPPPSTRTWIAFNINLSKVQMCKKLMVGSKQLEKWLRNMNIKNDKKI